MRCLLTRPSVLPVTDAPEGSARTAYLYCMNDTPHRTDAAIAAEWAAILAESEAELAAGLVVSGDEIMRELRECVARMEGKPGAEQANAQPDTASDH